MFSGRNARLDPVQSHRAEAVVGDEGDRGGGDPESRVRLIDPVADFRGARGAHHDVEDGHRSGELPAVADRPGEGAAADHLQSAVLQLRPGGGPGPGEGRQRRRRRPGTRIRL
jgi:hypothetical protein